MELAILSALEICKTLWPLEYGSISGERIQAYLTDTHESFDININSDWVLAEAMLNSGDVCLPNIIKSPFSSVKK